MATFIVPDIEQGHSLWSAKAQPVRRHAIVRVGRMAKHSRQTDDLRPLLGQRVVIVGGTSGMGLGAVRAAAKAGASVVVAGRRREADRGRVAPDEGHTTHAQVDVTDEQSVRSLFQQVGAVDHLFVWSFLDDAAREELRRKVRETFPARRIGTIEDIGHAAVFLMTNPYVTGAVLEVSGGEPLVTLDP